MWLTSDPGAWVNTPASFRDRTRTPGRGQRLNGLTPGPLPLATRVHRSSVLVISGGTRWWGPDSRTSTSRCTKPLRSTKVTPLNSGRSSSTPSTTSTSATPPAHWVTRTLEQRSEEHTSELQSPCNLVCRLLLEKKKQNTYNTLHHS